MGYFIAKPEEGPLTLVGGLGPQGSHLRRLPPLHPRSAPPPNISRGGLTSDVLTGSNVRRGGRRKADPAKKRCPLLGLISGNYGRETCKTGPCSEPMGGGLQRGASYETACMHV